MTENEQPGVRVDNTGSQYATLNCRTGKGWTY